MELRTHVCLRGHQPEGYGQAAVAVMKLLDNDSVRSFLLEPVSVFLTFTLQFLKQLASLFESCSERGSVWLTHKRRTRSDSSSRLVRSNNISAVTYDGEDSIIKKDLDDLEYPCLLRATDGKETKISTTVRLQFQSRIQPCRCLLEIYTGCTLDTASMHD